MASLLTAGRLSGRAHRCRSPRNSPLQMVVGRVVGRARRASAALVHAPGAVAGEGLYPLRTLACALACSGWPGCARLRLPGGVRRRDPDRRRAGAVQARDRALPLRARQPRPRSSPSWPWGSRWTSATSANPTSGCRGWWSGAGARLVIRPLCARAAARRVGAQARREELRDVRRPQGGGADPAGQLIVAEHIPDDDRLYGMVVVVVVLSVVVQGSLVPTVARLLGGADAGGGAGAVVARRTPPRRAQRGAPAHGGRRFGRRREPDRGPRRPARRVPG